MQTTSRYIAEQTKTHEECYYNVHCKNLMSGVTPLTLNFLVCVVLHLGRRNVRQAYFINGKQARTRESLRDLGVMTTNTLKYSQHSIAEHGHSQKRGSEIIFHHEIFHHQRR